MSATLTKPVKWHGGKHYLAPWIISHMPPRCQNPNKPADDDAGWLHYVEPYFGGGSVLLALDPSGISEVVNDINRGLMALWKALQSPAIFNALLHRLNMTPVAQAEWMQAIADQIDFANLPEWYDEKPIEAAATFFVKYRQSRQGLGRDFATLTRNRSRRGMNEQVSAWLNAIEGLPDLHARMKRVVILNDDALKVIKQQDGDKTLFYLDPPYLHETRSSNVEYGEHEMSWANHVQLLATLRKISGRFMLSGYHSELYDVYAHDFGWRCEELEQDKKSSSKKTKEKTIECLWMNF